MSEIDQVAGYRNGRRLATYPLSHQIFRLSWLFTWWLLASWTPAQLAPWRRLLLRMFGANIANTAMIYGTARVWYPPNLIMEDYSAIGPGVIVYCMDRITLEYHAVVSQRAHLCGGTHDIDDPQRPLLASPIVIGREAWIAAEAFVGPGVTVGEGVVLGARGVATKNLTPWAVYAGNPAKLLRTRKPYGDSQEVI